MKLWETFRYELTYQSRSASTLFYFVLLLALSFLMAAVVFVDEPLYGGYFLNAPYIVTKASLLTFFFIGLFVLAPFAGHAAARDTETRMHPLLFSSPIQRHVYLGGRFLAAFSLGALVMLAIPVGVFFAGLFPLENPELSGPMNVAAYLTTYFLLILPNTFFVIAFMFAVAVLNKRGILSYLIAVFTGVVVIASWQFLGLQQDNWTLANLVDPVGLTIMQELKPLWSANQKNTLLPALETSALLNRALWFVLSAGILLITYVRFNTSTVSKTDKKAERKRNQAENLPIEHYRVYQTDNIEIPPISKSFDWRTRALQIAAITRESFRLIALGWGWMALACMFLFVVLTGSMWFSDYYDIPELPVTGNLLGTLENVSDHGIWFIIPLLIIYYAGELVWRDRDARLNDIIGAAPVPVWVSFAGKFAGMVLALIVTQLFLIVAGILLQVSLGYYDFQTAVYLKILLGLRLADYVLLAVLAFTSHVILNQKYLAHFVAVLFYLFTTFGPQVGIESNMLLYASDPGWSYSDLRGLSPFMEPWLYYKLYWAAWALLLMVASTALWPRGTETGFLKRFRQGFRRDEAPIKTLAAVSVLMIGITGGFIFYSTHVLWPTNGPVETFESKARYEKRYGKFNGTAQPTVTRVKVHVEIYPDKGSAEFKGAYTLVNNNSKTIDTLYLSTSRGVEYHQLDWNQPVKSMVDEELDFRMFVLQKPMSPGDSLQLSFHVSYHPKGFPNSGMKTAIAQNGTYFGNEWLPAIGYQGGREIVNANDRKNHGLPPKTFLEPEAESYSQKRVQVDAVIGTVEGQVAVAPGRLLKRWTENGRSYFHYATENPVNHKLGFYSSEYKVYQAAWRPTRGEAVDISILYHPGHTHNLDRMVKGVQSSLTYLSRRLGKYPHDQIRLLEVPGYNKGLYAYPMNIFYREGFASLKPEEDPRGIDIVFATIAHEVSHQWWGSQVSPAPIKGAGLITETLAWYSAFEIVEEGLGEDMLLTLLDLARDDYFSPQERVADPLLQAAQTSLIYRKGPLALYALREYIGKHQVRRGLKTFFEQYSKPDSEKPIPTDLYREIRSVTPDSMQYLLHDLFETNTFWELKTESVAATQAVSGKWKVTLDVQARKYTVDQKGTETDVEMNDWIQVGVFSEDKGKEDQALLYLRQHRVRSGKQTIEIDVAEKPDVAGIDPNFLLMDLRRWDNVVGVTYQ